MNLAARVEKMAGQVDASLACEEALSRRLAKTDPELPDWKGILEALIYQARTTAGYWDHHAELARLQHNGVRHGHDRVEHVRDLVRDLRERVHSDALRGLVLIENERRCWPPLPDETLEALLP